MSNKDIHLAINHGQSGLASLKAQWLQLANKDACHFVHSPFWYEAKIKNFPEESSGCLFVSIYLDGQLVCVIPLEKKKLGVGLSYLQFFYPNEMGVCDQLFAQNASLDWGFLVEQIRRQVPGLQFIRLQHFWDDGHTEKTGILDYATLKKTSHKPGYLFFPGQYDEMMASYSSKFRRNLRRLSGKAEASGNLALSCVSEREELMEAFHVFMGLEASGWKGQEGTSISQQTAVKAYYTDFIETYGALGQCQINLLFCGEKAIAGQFCLKIDKTLFLLKIAYDHEMSSLSPGQLIIDKVIHHGCATGAFNKLHFVTDYDWMARWKPKHQDAFLAYIPTSFLGAMALKALVFRNKVQAFLQKQSKA